MSRRQKTAKYLFYISMIIITISCIFIIRNTFMDTGINLCEEDEYCKEKEIGEAGLELYYDSVNKCWKCKIFCKKYEYCKEKNIDEAGLELYYDSVNECWKCK